MLLFGVTRVSHHHKQNLHICYCMNMQGKEIQFFVRERLSEILATDFNCHRYAVTKIELFTYAFF